MKIYNYITDEIADRYSSYFENNNLKPDEFILFEDLSAEELNNMKRLNELKNKINLTTDERVEMANLLLDLRPCMPNSSDFNKIQAGIYSVQVFLRDNIALFIQEKQNKLNELVNNFNYKGEYDILKQYYVGNHVKIDEVGFTCIKDNIGQLPNAEKYTDCWIPFAIKGDKGDMGITTNFKGDYNEQTIYNLGDSCSYENVIYYALENNLQDVHPTISSKWVSTVNFIISNNSPKDTSKLWLDISETDGKIKRYVRGKGWIELNGKNDIGTEDMGTDSITIKGAIAEVNSKTETLKGDILNIKSTINNMNYADKNSVNNIQNQVTQNKNLINANSNNINNINSKINSQQNTINNISSKVNDIPKIYYSTSNPTSSTGKDGDIWIVY